MNQSWGEGTVRCEHSTPYAELHPSPVAIPLQPLPTQAVPTPTDGPPTEVWTDGSYDGTTAGFGLHVAEGSYVKPSDRAETVPMPNPLSLEDLNVLRAPPGTCFGRSNLCHDAYTAEIVAIIAALVVVPTNNPIRIIADNQPVILVTPSFATRSARQQLKTANHNLYRVLTFLLSLRPDVKLEWVRSHVGVQNNEVADRLAKAGATGSRNLIPAINPQTLPIQTLYDLCRLPFEIHFTPVKVTQTQAQGYTTTITQQPPVIPTGNIKKHTTKLFATLASQAFQHTSYRAQSFKQLPQHEAVDYTLWNLGISGKIQSVRTQHLDAHMLKLATHSHFSITSLLLRSKEWHAHFRKPDPPPPPPPVVLPLTPTLHTHSPANPAARYDALWEETQPVCLACGALLSREEAENNLLHILSTRCTNTHVASLREGCHNNLSRRLIPLGAPDWWSTDPTSSLTNPTPVSYTHLTLPTKRIV